MLQKVLATPYPLNFFDGSGYAQEIQIYIMKIICLIHCYLFCNLHVFVIKL